LIRLAAFFSTNSKVARLGEIDDGASIAAATLISWRIGMAVAIGIMFMTSQMD
jgi:hypothetical protein